MPAGAGNLVGDLVAGFDADIVAGYELLPGTHTDGEGSPLAEILDCLVARGEIHRDFLIIGYSAPCGVHCIGNIILAISGDYQNGLRIAERLRAKILSCHIFIIICQSCKDNKSWSSRNLRKNDTERCRRISP